MPATVVAARTVSQVSVDVMSEYPTKRCTFSSVGAPAMKDMSVLPPTAMGQNHRFMSAPNA
jgi:hypothetical protein